MKKFYRLKLLLILFIVHIPLGSNGQLNLDSMRQMIFEKTNELRVLAGYPVLIPLDSLM